MERNIFVIILSFLFYIFGVPNTTAAPIISATSGSIADGLNITITGSNFGTNALNFEWLGTNIEAGTEGNIFGKTGWATYADSTIHYAVRYNDAQAHSGTQSLLCHFDDVGGEHYDSGIFYESSTSLTNVYVTFWVRFNPITGDKSSQWKSWRISDMAGFGMDVGFGNFNWINADTKSWVDNYYFFRRAGGVSGQVSFSSGYPIDQWFRIEGWITKASAEDTPDGAYSITIIDGTQITEIASFSGAITHTAADAPWKYLQFGQYWGNIDAPIDREANVWYDDIYIDTTRARVEIGDNATWSSCTHRDIQIPTAWADGEITISVNRGSFDPCETYYLFVVDADGNVNATGYPIRIVTGAGEAPCPPTGLEISQ